MGAALAFLSLIAAHAKAPPAPPAPCTYPMLRLAADQPEARKPPPAAPRARGDRNPPCAILQNWSPGNPTARSESA